MSNQEISSENSNNELEEKSEGVELNYEESFNSVPTRTVSGVIARSNDTDPTDDVALQTRRLLNPDTLEVADNRIGLIVTLNGGKEKTTVVLSDEDLEDLASITGE
ncbi:hypothetical protein [Natronococcus wangiae]|uniref:hypothetical protein n=1 Tax=Natronococcus wangiae TaxID=3068275 RepID=UPI00273ED373|nr:hypothetical protein [Natronococcus sp. AD5]